MLHSTGHIVEVSLIRLVGGGTLPVRKGIGKHIGDHGVIIGVGSEQVVGSTVSELVPGVRRSDSGAGERLAHGADVLVELGAGQIAAVQGLGADGDGLDLVLVAGDVFLQGGKVLDEGGVVGAGVGFLLGADPE